MLLYCSCAGIIVRSFCAVLCHKALLVSSQLPWGSTIAYCSTLRDRPVINLFPCYDFCQLWNPVQDLLPSPSAAPETQKSKWFSDDYHEQKNENYCLTLHTTMHPHIQPPDTAANLQRCTDVASCLRMPHSFLIYPVEVGNMSGNTAVDSLNCNS